jgi:hypothetical protein
VITEQALKLGHHRMSSGNGLGLELLQSLLDLCGIHLHRTTPSIGFAFAIAPFGEATNSIKAKRAAWLRGVATKDSPPHLAETAFRYQ